MHRITSAGFFCRFTHSLLATCMWHAFDSCCVKLAVFTLLLNFDFFNMRITVSLFCKALAVGDVRIHFFVLYTSIVFAIVNVRCSIAFIILTFNIDIACAVVNFHVRFTLFIVNVSITFFADILQGLMLVIFNTYVYFVFR
jgi:hypothetical protein